MTRPDFREFRHSNDIIVDHHALEHSAKGSSWKDHKYIRKENGRYIYKESKIEEYNIDAMYSEARKMMDEIDKMQSDRKKSIIKDGYVNAKPTENEILIKIKEVNAFMDKISEYEESEEQRKKNDFYNSRYSSSNKKISHSAEGSSWKKHKYVKKIDGVYYYPIGYDDGRTIDELKGGDSKNKEDQIDEIKNHFDKYLSERGIDWTKLPKEEVDQMQRDLIDQLKGKEKSDSKTGISKDDVEELAKEVIRGKMGNGQERKDILGERYEEVQKRVNELMKGSTASKKISSEKPSTAAEEAAKKAISLVKAYRTKDKKKN